jgi:hypothetical protein
MKFEWINNSANVGRLELRVRQSLYSGKWNATVFLVLNPIGSHHEFESDAAAREWCEEWVRDLFSPALDAARAEEREACAARLGESAKALAALAAECVKGSECRRIYETQAKVLCAAIGAIRARSKESKP